MKNDRSKSKYNPEKIFSFAFEVNVILPVILVIGLIIFGHNIYKSFFMDSKYCIGSKEKYELYFGEGIKNKRISSVEQIDGRTAILYHDGEYGLAIETCDLNSSGKNKLLPKDLKAGDTIFKKMDSNEFTILRNGKEFIFKIDGLRNLDGTEKK